ncbi:hypothetical protein PUNSTDRAFT_75319 [Punctularia strigosozonata HHB-11173 SS5]|uniref:DUF155 domain-containing protein n=1 Tax=Punctularia strigosozonata (strain HHB-11173) TaxID=741275 RepID=R7S3B5_PUNST|nr:uncharacterized protein PUNSTDRAFT_75319 [Punctularia strigosozonata HHB-11173 SS5]EIN04900.1 hypothetical protein PUNSTDRAFT_75319 [Punctularia strigosozonata HHB-11173 SS5]
MASSVPSAYGEELPSSTKTKPKAATPLRRTAADSLPIRVNPTPTRGNIQPVITLATAERYLLSRLRLSTPSHLQAQMLHDAWYIPRWSTKKGTQGDSAQEGEIFVFGNGSFVCWGLDEKGAQNFAEEVLRARRDVEIGRLKEPEVEELDFVTDPTEWVNSSAPKTRLQGDLIILGEAPPISPDAMLTTVPPTPFSPETILARYAFSQALSRSTALSALEVSLEDYLAGMALLPQSLEKTGKPGMSRKQLIKKLGELLKYRQGLNLNRENFSDTPDYYWDEPVLEGYFNSLSNALEIRARTRSINEKITYAAELQAVLRQLLTESSAHRMELIIIVLIAVEVVIALIREGPELWRKLTRSGDESEAHTALVH